MKQQLLWILTLSSLSLGVDNFKFSGNVEGGWASSWSSAEKSSRFLIDNLHLKTVYLPSDKVKVVVENAVSLHATTTVSPLAQAFDSRRYYSRFQLNSGSSVGASTFTFANQTAYIEHVCSDWMTTAIGNVRLPLGLEGAGDRFSKASYYWSTSRGVATDMGWSNDLGMLVTLDILGTIEFGIFDGRATQSSWSPTAAIRWSRAVDAGNLKLTPTLSALVGAFAGSPGDMAFTVGTDLGLSLLTAKLEFFYTKVDRSFGTDTSTKVWSLWFEPAVDVGFIKLAALADFNSDKIATADSRNDLDLGLAITKEYNSKSRLRLTYQHVNLMEKQGTHQNDFRLLFGTEW